MFGFSDGSVLPAPAEGAFDHFAAGLADGVAFVAGGAPGRWRCGGLAFRRAGGLRRAATDNQAGAVPDQHMAGIRPSDSRVISTSLQFTSSSSPSLRHERK